jgi:homoserine dehydrogenase
VVGYHSADVAHARRSAVTPAPIRVGVLGAGTVGREVVSALMSRPDAFRTPEGVVPQLLAVAVRDTARASSLGLADLVSDAPAHVVADDRIDVVVELIGGDEPAHTLVAAALSMGKSVVTANKHVVAHHGPELEAIARRTGASFRFEAAVGGGIPVLSPLARDLAANRIERVRGIVNGTTNFILTAMTDPDRPIEYEDALGEAQRLGYAESDPRGDVEGRDAVNKLVILSRLAFDRWLAPATIPTRPGAADGPAGPGITTVSLADQQDARSTGRIIRLIATASRDAEDAIEAAVLPTAVPADGPLGRTVGVQNRIEVDARPVGRVGFDGPGAGGPATASAVLADLMAIGRGEGSTWSGRPAATMAETRPPAGGDTLRTRSGVRYPIDD